MKKNKIIIVLIISFIFGINNLFSEDFIIKAMKDEIDRTMKSLTVESLQKPYFVEYTIKFNGDYDIKSTLGVLSDSNENHNITLTVGIRVGSYKFDNSNFFDFGLSFFGSGDNEEVFKNRTIPLEADYNLLRRELWLATDAAYKQASEIYSKKVAALQNVLRKDTTWDFLPEPPETNIEAVPNIPDEKINIDFGKWISEMKNISKVLCDYPEINISSVGFEYLPKTIYYLNSEGMKYVKNEYFSGFEAVAATQSNDGMPLAAHFSSYSLKPAQLPSEDSLIHGVRNMADNLRNLLKAPTLDDSYSGPILFDGEAAAEIFAQIFAPCLVAQRAALTEQGQQDDDRYSAFQSKIGGRVLPEFLSVNAIPKTKHIFGTETIGSYLIDDDGIPAEDVTLVKDGYLKTLLSSRVPTKRIRQSNGSKRGGAAMLNIIELSSDEKHSKDEKELVERMLKLCKDRELPYGIIVKNIINQNILYTSLYRLASLDAMNINPREQNFAIFEAYKIYPDGTQELIRGVNGKGFTVQSFKDILEIGKKPYVLNYLAPSVTSSYVSGGSSYIGSTIITPALLFEDGEIKPIEGDFPKLPFVTSPLSEEKK